MLRRGKTIFSLVIIILFVVATVFVVAVFSYNEKTTHPALTDQIVDFYNLSFPDQPISATEKEWIVEGSIDEDTMPRWINHYYDSVNNKGWNAEEAGRISSSTLMFLNSFLLSDKPPLASRYWAQAPSAQAEYKEFKGDRTWQRALYEMVKNNNKQEAFYTLGFILHLIEDASVPDHTRNDTHVHDYGLPIITGDFGSPYEEYLKKYTRVNENTLPVTAKNLYQAGAKPMAFENLNGFFNEVATNSNRYFFSKDTIPSNPLASANEEEKRQRKYRFPEVVDFDDNYGYGFDRNGAKFIVARAELEKLSGRILKPSFLLDDPNKDKEILDAYFLRLSREAIVNGAGVIKLFFDEVKKMQGNSIADLPPETSGVNSVLVTVKNIENFVGKIFAYFKPTTGTLVAAPAPAPAAPVTIKSLDALLAKNQPSGDRGESPLISLNKEENIVTTLAARRSAPPPVPLADKVKIETASHSNPPLSNSDVSGAVTALAAAHSNEPYNPSQNSLPAWALPAIIAFGLAAVAVALREIFSSQIPSSSSSAPPAPPVPLAPPSLYNYAPGQYGMVVGGVWHDIADPERVEAIFGKGSIPSVERGAHSAGWSAGTPQPWNFGDHWGTILAGGGGGTVGGTYSLDHLWTGFHDVIYGGMAPTPELYSRGFTSHYGKGSKEQEMEIAAFNQGIKNYHYEDLPKQSAATPIFSASPASLASVEHYWPVHFRPGLSEAQQKTITHMLDTRKNEGQPLNEIDAHNYAFATSQTNWQRFVGKRPEELFA